MNSAQQQPVKHRYTHFLQDPEDTKIVSDVNDHSPTTVSRKSSVPVSVFFAIIGKMQLSLSLTLLRPGEKHLSSCVGEVPEAAWGDPTPTRTSASHSKPETHMLDCVMDAFGVCPSLRPLGSQFWETSSILLPLC